MNSDLCKDHLSNKSCLISIVHKKKKLKNRQSLKTNYKKNIKNTQMLTEKSPFFYVKIQ